MRLFATHTDSGLRIIVLELRPDLFLGVEDHAGALEALRRRMFLDTHVRLSPAEQREAHALLEDGQHILGAP